jgi:hypothetical protein
MKLVLNIWILLQLMSQMVVLIHDIIQLQQIPIYLEAAHQIVEVELLVTINILLHIIEKQLIADAHQQQ